MQHRCKVKSVFVYGKSNRIYYEFFDSEGKLRQKSTGLTASKANRRRATLAIPEFEKRCWEQAKRDTLLKKSIGHYASLYVKSNVGLSKMPLYRKRLDKAIAFFGGEQVHPKDITKLMLREFLTQLNVTRETMLDYLVPIRAVLEYAVEDGAVESNIAEGFKLPQTSSCTENSSKVQPFKPEEVDTLLETAEGVLKNYLGIAFFTGMRPEEIIGLMISDIDLKQQTVEIQRAISHGQIKTTKTAKSTRVIPIFNRALPYFEAQVNIAKKKNSLYLFSKDDGRHLDDIRDIRGYQANPKIRRRSTKWYALREKVGLEKIDLRNTRHTFAVEAIKSGRMTLQEIAAMLGHTSLKSLLNHYAKWIDGGITHLSREIFSEAATGNLTGNGRESK